MFARRDTNATPFKQTKTGRLIKQRDIDATSILALGHHIMIVQLTKDAATRERGEHTVILHLTKANQVHRAPLICCCNHLADALQFLHQPCLAPMPFPSLAILQVILPLIVHGVKSILDVVGQHRERLLRPYWEAQKNGEHQQYVPSAILGAYFHHLL